MKAEDLRDNFKAETGKDVYNLVHSGKAGTYIEWLENKLISLSEVKEEEQEESHNLIQDIMAEFERAKNFGIKEINWLPFKQACQRFYMKGKKSNS